MPAELPTNLKTAKALGLTVSPSPLAGADGIVPEIHVVGDSEVEVSVCDSGIGIPKDRLKDIFETFYTTKRTGTGLGLSIMRTIVEASGDGVWAENQSGGSSVFRFTLPLTNVR